jgi:hypothetical protein
MLGQEDFAFWFGDLNYRLDDIPGDDVRRLLHLYTQNEIDPPVPSFGAHKENVDPSSVNDDGASRRSNDSDLSEEDSIAMIDNDIEPEMDPASLKATIASLLPHDQLRSQQKKKVIFHDGWREGSIDFLPSYKYDVGLIGRFDSSEKQRSPSWCDRILYRTRRDYSEFLRRVREEQEAKARDEEMKRLGLEQAAEDDGVLFDYDPESDGAQGYDENDDDAGEAAGATGENDPADPVHLLCYTSHQTVVSSDHKPLHAEFVLAYDGVIPELKAKVHQEVVRELDRAENEARPDITLVVDRPLGGAAGGSATTDAANEPDTISFGDVRHDVPVKRGLTLANTGGVSATFCFRYRPDAEVDRSDRVSPPWLNVRVDRSPDHASGSNAQEYTLSPGESVQVQLVLRVQEIEFVRRLNRMEANIDDIIVLRVNNGRDHFISIRGTWLPTCFGLSLSELTRIPEGGVRQLNSKEARLSHLDGLDGKHGARTSAPRELFRLTEAIVELAERSVAEWDMISDSLENRECPWVSGSGWPFDRESWVYKQNNERHKLLSSVREAIDTNTPFNSHFPPELPALFRVELLSEALLGLLRSLDGGLIPASLWKELEELFLVQTKSNRSSTADERQSWILDILSSSPIHSVSFTFLTFMLNRIANEVAPTPIPPPPVPPPKSQPQSPTIPSIPSSPTPSSGLSFPFRFKSRSRASTSSDTDPTPMLSPTFPRTPTTATHPNKPHPALIRRQEVNNAFARIFAGAIFPPEVAPPEKDKERRAWEERRCKVLEPFLVTGQEPANR